MFGKVELAFAMAYHTIGPELFWNSLTLPKHLATLQHDRKHCRIDDKLFFFGFHTLNFGNKTTDIGYLA